MLKVRQDCIYQYSQYWGDRQDPGACWPSSLVEMTSSTLWEDSVSKIRESNSGIQWFLASRQICVHVLAHMHICMYTSHQNEEEIETGMSNIHPEFSLLQIWALNCDLYYCGHPGERISHLALNHRHIWYKNGFYTHRTKGPVGYSRQGNR